MRSLVLALLATTIAAFSVPGSLAQNQINLGGEKLGTLAFVATGGGDFTVNLCDNLNFQRKCVGGDTVKGFASGNGEFVGYNGFYIITGNATTTGAFDGCVGTTCTWTLSTANPGLNFDFNSKVNGLGTNFLSGTLKMLSLTEVPNGKLFLETITLQLSNIGGALAPLFTSSGGVVIFNVQSQTTLSLSQSPAGRGIQGVLLNGDVSTTPEPTTMVLLGSGFLLVGGFLRKKSTA